MLFVFVARIALVTFTSALNHIEHADAGNKAWLNNSREAVPLYISDGRKSSSASLDSQDSVRKHLLRREASDDDEYLTSHDDPLLRQPSQSVDMDRMTAAAKRHLSAAGNLDANVAGLMEVLPLPALEQTPSAAPVIVHVSSKMSTPAPTLSNIGDRIEDPDPGEEQSPTMSSPTYASTTSSPTIVPTTPGPTGVQATPHPTNVSTGAPTKVPTAHPTTKHPTTKYPTTKHPTNHPTKRPTTKAPTKLPTKRPTTAAPSRSPTPSPTEEPTTFPLYPVLRRKGCPAQGIDVADAAPETTVAGGVQCCSKSGASCFRNGTNARNYQQSVIQCSSSGRRLCKVTEMSKCCGQGDANMDTSSVWTLEAAEPVVSWTFHLANWDCGPHEAESHADATLAQCEEFCIDYTYAALWTNGLPGRCRCYDSCVSGTATNNGWENMLYTRASYILGQSNSTTCPEGHVVISSESDCGHAATALGLNLKDTAPVATVDQQDGHCYLPAKCSNNVDNHYAYFSNCQPGRAHLEYAPICRGVPS
jgi:hypothetical protein